MLKEAKFEPKRMRTVASVEGKPPYLTLIEAKRGAKPGIIWESELAVCKKDGSYTDEVNKIYHREQT